MGRNTISDYSTHVQIFHFLQETLDSDRSNSAMTMTMADVDASLTNIHDVIQKSGLHFVLTQTPWSSYITIRRKFTNARYTVNSNLNVTNDELKSMNVKNQQLEQRLVQIEVEKVGLEEELKVS